MSDNPQKRVAARIAPREGDTLDGRYELEECIAAGGMGMIFRATRQSTGGTAAVKVMLPEVAERTEMTRRFKREATLAEKLGQRSDYIVTLLDFAQTDQGLYYLAMEFLEGEDLKSLLARESPLPVRKACDIATQMLLGLAEAHDHDVVHRDLKPSNVFMVERRREADRVKLLDFGIAKSIAPGADSVTKTGQMPGTMRYSAPDAIITANAPANASDIPDSPGKPADVYSVGLLLVEMLLGRRVHSCDQPLEYFQCHFYRPAPLPRPLAGTQLGAVIERSLAKHPGDRYADADAMWQALNGAAEQFPADARIDPRSVGYDASDIPNDVSGRRIIVDNMDFLHDQPACRVIDATFSSGEAGASTASANLAGDPTTGTGPTDPTVIKQNEQPTTPVPDATPTSTATAASSETIEQPARAPATTPPNERPPRRASANDQTTADADVSRSIADAQTDDAADQEARPMFFWLASGGGASLLFALAAFALLGVGGSESGPEEKPDDRAPTAVVEQPPGGNDESAAAPPTTDDATTDTGDGDTAPEQPARQTIRVETSPGAASIVRAGESLGEAPVELTVESSADPFEITARTEGYEAKTVTVDPTAGTTRRIRLNRQPEPPPAPESTQNEPDDPQPTRSRPQPDPTPTRQPSSPGGDEEPSSDNGGDLDDFLDQTAID